MAKRRSEWERAKWVARWRASGRGCERFARQHGLSPASLYRWANQLEVPADSALPKFAELRVIGGALGALEVQHPSGCVVRVSGAVDEVQLTAVLRALGAC